MSYPIKPNGDNIVSESNIFAISGNKIPMSVSEILNGYSNKNELVTPLTSEPDAHRFNSFLYQMHNTVVWLIGYAEALFANKLELSGGTMTGNIVMGANKVTSTFTPTSASDLANKQYVDDVASASWFLGEYKFFDYPTPPTMPAGVEVIEADGRELSRTTYASYFSRVGTTYGAGDGSTTFNAPDRRGVVGRGWDNGRGLDSGHAFGAYQADTLQNFTARFSQGASGADFISGAIRYIDSPSSYVSGRHDGGGDANYISGRLELNPSITARTSTETRMKNISEYVMVRIK